MDCIHIKVVKIIYKSVQATLCIFHVITNIPHVYPLLLIIVMRIHIKRNVIGIIFQIPVDIISVQIIQQQLLSLNVFKMMDVN